MKQRQKLSSKADLAEIRFGNPRNTIRGNARPTEILPATENVRGSIGQHRRYVVFTMINISRDVAARCDLPSPRVVSTFAWRSHRVCEHRSIRAISFERKLERKTRSIGGARRRKESETKLSASVYANWGQKGHSTRQGREKERERDRDFRRKKRKRSIESNPI